MGTQDIKDFSLYDMHIHTKYSNCGVLSPKKILKLVQKSQIDGIAITGHDTMYRVKKILSLKKPQNIEIIPGEEVSTNIGHLLVYYLATEIRSRQIEEVLDEVKKQGAISCIARPFASLRTKAKLDMEIIRKLNCIETFNGRNSKKDNLKAEELAEKFNKAKLAGSDAHFSSELFRGITKFRGNLINAIKKKETIPIEIHKEIKPGILKMSSLAVAVSKIFRKKN